MSRQALPTTSELEAILNELIADLGGGLFPFGWVKLLWRLRTSSPKGGRIFLAGVSRPYQATALGASMLVWMFADLIKTGKELGFQWVELSWVLEDNARSITLCQRLGGPSAAASTAPALKRYSAPSDALSPTTNVGSRATPLCNA